MGLRKCPRCREIVGDESLECPRCGVDFKAAALRRVVWWSVIAAGFFWALNRFVLKAIGAVH
jgi:hypothetical protein